MSVQHLIVVLVTFMSMKEIDVNIGMNLPQMKQQIKSSSKSFTIVWSDRI